MDTIWSYVIWDKLGFSCEGYKIHEEPLERTHKLVLDYFNGLSIEEIQSELIHLSWFVTMKFDAGYYDGHFHEIAQEADDKKPITDREKIKIHETATLPLLLNLVTSLKVDKEELEFAIKFLEMYNSKLPPTTCGINTKEK